MVVRRQQQAIAQVRESVLALALALALAPAQCQAQQAAKVRSVSQVHPQAQVVDSKAGFSVWAGLLQGWRLDPRLEEAQHCLQAQKCCRWRLERTLERK